MKVIYMLMVLISLGLVSCKKITYTDTSVNGKVIRQNDNTPLSGYEVHLIETEIPAKPFSQIIRSLLATEVTSENGGFDFGELELKRRERFEYTVEFDPKNEYTYFATQSWQYGNYESVNFEEQVEKGIGNSLTLNMVEFGKVRMYVANQSSIDEIQVDIMFHHNGETSPFGRHVVKQGDTSSFHGSPIDAIGGDAVLEYLTSDMNGNLLETFSLEVLVPYQDTVDVYFTFE